MKAQIFQIVSSTRSTPNGFGNSSGRNQPPPPPDPTIVATQTEMMRQILLYLQQQSQQQQPHGNRIDAQGQCLCLNLSTSIGGTRSKVEGGDRHALEPEGTREDTKHKIYTGSGS
jgi:hypothetical protein